MIISSIRNIIRQTISSVPKLQARPAIATLTDDVGNDLTDDAGNTLISLIFGAGGEPEPPPGGDPWFPTELASLNGWYDVSDTDSLTVISNKIDVWDDKSGLGNHLVANTSSTRIDYGIRQLNSIDIATNGTSANVNMDITNTPSVIEVCGVFTPISNVSARLCCPMTNEARDGELFLLAASNQISFDGTGTKQGRYTLDGGVLSGFDTNHTTTININDFVIFTGEYDNAVTAEKAFSSPFDYVSSNGDFAEVIYCSAALSESDRQKVEGYLAWKWGLEANLPVGHPYELAAPTT